MLPNIALANSQFFFLYNTNSIQEQFLGNNIDLFHNGNQIKYSFVLMLISLSDFSAMGKIEKNVQTEGRLVDSRFN